MEIKGPETKVLSKDIREHLDELIDNDTDLKLQRLAHIFSGTKNYEEEFHQRYGRPFAGFRPHFG